MSPSKKRVKRIKVHVPRHNSQRIGPALTAQIETIAKEKRIRTDVRQPTNEATSVIALAIVGPRLSRSPFLRADRNTRKVLPNGTRCYLPLVPSGAHSGTWVHNSKCLHKKPLYIRKSSNRYRRFQVEEDSDLYYDPTPLLEYQKEDKQGPPHVVEGLPSSSSNPQPSHRGQLYPMAGHHSANGVAMSPIVATPTRHGVPGQMGVPYPVGPQFHAIPPSQFYGGGDRGSQMVTRGMGIAMGMEMGITPDVRNLSRRI